MMDGVILLLSLLGFVLLFIAIPRHQQDWLRRKLTGPASALLRLAGFLSLAMAYLVSGKNFGWGYGLVLWLGWLTVAASVVVAAHTNRERILARGGR